MRNGVSKCGLRAPLLHIHNFNSNHFHSLRNQFGKWGNVFFFSLLIFVTFSGHSIRISRKAFENPIKWKMMGEIEAKIQKNNIGSPLRGDLLPLEISTYDTSGPKQATLQICRQII